MGTQQVVSQQVWIEARRALLNKEKALTRQRDELARERRSLPWVKVEKDYVFDSPRGKVRLADLFGDCGQLIVYHFMFGPQWEEGCPSCSFLSDHLGGAIPHLAARDVSLALVSRAPLAKIEGFKRRMGWRFNWVSSHASDFNFDFHASFAPQQRAGGKVDYNYCLQEFPSDEAPGASVFIKDKSGAVFHTYSTYARGLDALIGTYTLLDLTPRGRDEDGLPFTMSWVRYHDRYEGGGFADADKPYWPEEATADAAATSSCGCGSEKHA